MPINKTISNEIDLFNRTSPIECFKLNIISVYCVLVLVLGVTFNTMLLKVFAQHKKLRTSINMIIIVLTITNLFGSISEMSFVIPSNWYCRLVNFSFSTSPVTYNITFCSEQMDIWQNRLLRIRRHHVFRRQFTDISHVSSFRWEVLKKQKPKYVFC